jgi:hypothetical protein
MCTQGGGASAEKTGRFSDPFSPRQYVSNVTNCIKLKQENVPADKAELPFSLSPVWMNVVCGSLENRADVGCAFRDMTWMHGLCRGSNNNAGEGVRTYLTVCIAECPGLLIGNVRVDGVFVFGISGVGFCCIIFLANWGSIAWVARFASCCVAWFALVVHDIVGIDRLGGRARSTSRAPCSRLHCSDERVKCRRNLALVRRRSRR